ncbi:hypothetical protein COV18_04280 [Candidatus Woesearchaeota archaeon CG10_big_fil_rev_8_21_14_0_10_37_12]|nr:MAG: hypothetical protein COV18_04280 [Candidatus Woesearchaeota archaeon CG10_big_fil_rev_8_21_14_0_10_37_12]
MKKYLDANVFILAIVNDDALGRAARALLDDVVKGEVQSVTSFLTFDEVAWALRKVTNKEKAYVYVKNFLEMPHLEFLDVNKNVIWKAFYYLQEHKLDPRDAIHIASAIVSGASSIVTEDKDFSNIKEIKVEGL